MANWYDLNGSLLTVEAAFPALEEPLQIYLGELRTDRRASAPDYTIRIDSGPPRGVPAEAQLLHEGPLPEAPVCRLSGDDTRRWFVIPERISLEFSTSERVAQMTVAPGHERLAGATAAINALYAALFVTGQTLVHAAALRLPRQNSAFVLFAPSGAGKTTTSLALALQGFGLLTDDATVLTGTGTSASDTLVWGLPRPPKVHRKTAAMLPEIGRLLGSKWNEEDEQSLAPAALRSVGEVEPGRSYPLRALVLLGQRVTGPHVLKPMRKADLFVHFATDNVARAPQGVLSDDLARFNRFVALVAKTPAYELNVGSDLSTLGEAIAGEFGTADQPILNA